MKQSAQRKTKTTAMSALRPYLRRHTKVLSAAAGSMLVRAIILLALPWPLKFIIDSVLFQHALPSWLVGVLPDPVTQRLALLNILGVIMLTLGAVDALLTYLGNRWLLHAGQWSVFDIRCDLFAHLQRLSLAFHRRQRAGDLMTRLGGDIQTLQDFVVSIGTGVFAHLLTLVGMAAIMLIIDWRYALLAIAVVPVLFIAAHYYTDKLKAALRLARKKEGELWGGVQEIIASMHLVQAYGRESRENDRFAAQAQQSLDANLEANELQAQFTPLVSVVMTTAAGVIAWYGATQVLNGSITAGELLVFLAYLRGMAAPVRQFAKIARVVGKASVAAERISEVFAEEPEIKDAAGAVTPPVCRGELEFRAVWFGYAPSDMVLRNISLRIEPAQTVALVGSTGAGKSTVASLVPRFHDPASGAIFLDGVDLRQLSLAYVRRQVALVLQEAFILHASVWENIAYGAIGAGREAAMAAATAAGVHDIIDRLPYGYDTVVGERGATLSGGQRQCISIARAMLRDARIVILDEPTSGLDAVMERRVMEALRRLTQGRTTLIIAHRLSTIIQADRIVVLERGGVVQSGTHHELIQQHGRYLDLWSCSNDGSDTKITASGVS